MTVIITVKIELDDMYDGLTELEDDVRMEAVMWGDVLNVEAREVDLGTATGQAGRPE